jgi:Sec-independent protein translocase protein TatA
MGMHLVDVLVVALIGLALLGPKMLESVARNAGKGVSQAKDMKDKIMAELPMEEVSKFSENIPSVPLNSRDAVRMLITPEKSAKSEPTSASAE